MIPDAGLEQVREACDVDLWEEELPPARDELLRRVADKEGLLTLLTDRVDDELLDAAGPQLKVVSNFAVGFDNIDVPALTRRKIPAGNTPGVLTETTADLAFALLMAAARRIPESVEYVREGRWQTWGPMLLMGVDIHGATLGIVGFGRIGREMARRGRGFGMEILYHDVHPATADEEAELGARRVEMEELLRDSDFISLHVNLTDETHHLID
ncbi:MAG: D-glycerate dehydrogenase, partial [Chloroflexi bacterium]|nr:D-glycerate dehydrogenase [Chloroflexota bacterium]